MTEVAGLLMFTGDPEVDAYLQECNDYVYGGFCKGCGRCCSAETGISIAGMGQIGMISKELGTDSLAETVRMVGRCDDDGINPEEKFYGRYDDTGSYFMRAVGGACAFLDSGNKCYINSFKPEMCMNSHCAGLHNLYRLLRNKVLTPDDAENIRKRIGKPGLLDKAAEISGRLDGIVAEDGTNLDDLLLAGCVATIGKPNIVRDAWNVASKYKSSLVG